MISLFLGVSMSESFSMNCFDMAVDILQAPFTRMSPTYLGFSEVSSQSMLINFNEKED